jgi:hypothetical protein
LNDPFIGKRVENGSPFSLSGNHASFSQDFEVARNSGLGDFERLSQIADIDRVFSDFIKNEDACRVRQAVTDMGMELGDLRFELNIHKKPHEIDKHMHIYAYMICEILYEFTESWAVKKVT